MFTIEHFIWIGLCTLFVVLMMYLSIRKNFSTKSAGYIMCLICLVSEISKIMSDMLDSPKGGMYLDPRCLPFHLCSLMIFTTFYITFSKNEKIKQIVINFVSIAGTLGSICAILIPTNGTDFTKILAYQCFVYHAGLLWFSLYLIISKKAKFSSQTLLNNIIIMILLGFIMIYVNGALSIYNTNFMYVVSPPMDNLPYLNLDHGWYVYFIHLSLAGIILLSLFQLPFVLVAKTRKN